MGDTSTHKEIAEAIMAILRPARDGEEVYYFELGNWLTDISQMRDPTAMVGAKPSIWSQKTNIFSGEIAELVSDLQEYLDDLMGLPGPQGGLLAAWLRELCNVIGIEKFRKNGISPERFQDIYDLHFTQYYPHEHVDFPPWPRHDIIGERVPSEWAQHQCSKYPAAGSGRNIYQYTEEQLIYLSDLLTVVDQKWARVKPPEGDAQDLQEKLTRFGHVSHALEDFFFHSNFVEQAWAQSGKELPEHGDDGGDDDDDEEEAGPSNPFREKRRYMRRMRAPMGSGDDLATDASKPMDQVYTGFFAAKDVFHTLIDGLKGIVHKELPYPADQYLTSVLEKRDKALTPDQREQKRKQQLANHKARLYNDEYVMLARAAGATDPPRLHEKSVAAIERLCQMDKNLWQKYDSKIKNIDLGISGFVKVMLEMAADEAERSKTVWSKLDTDKVTSDERTDNGASNENIGSHSLMAKDSIRKHPLRQQAFNIAKVVAVYVAKVMVDPSRFKVPVSRSVPESTAAADGGSSNTAALADTDWLHLVQHFVCHPLEAEMADDDSGVTWWSWVMKDPDPNKTGHQLKNVQNRGVTERRLLENKQKELEQKYDQLAYDAEDEWKNAKDNAVGVWVGLITAGAIAGAIVGAAVGGPAGAVVGALIGAVAGIVVGVLGAIIGSLF
jgi:hypothetical protein